MLFERILFTVFPIFAIALAGYLYARKHRPEMATANRLNMDIFVPALVFDALSDQGFDLGLYQALALGGVIVVLGSGLILWPITRLLGFQLKTFLPPMMYNNSGNMGLPLVLLAFGEHALPAAVVLFMIENTLHFTLGAYMLDHRAGLLRVLRIPVVVASLAGLAVAGLSVRIPEMVALPIEMLGQVSIPLMLFSLGVRLVDIDFRHWKIGAWGALLCPLSGLLMALLGVWVLGLSGLQASQLILFGALPPAVLNFMFAERYQQEPAKVAAIVMLGNLASLITIPITLYFVLR